MFPTSERLSRKNIAGIRRRVRRAAVNAAARAAMPRCCRFIEVLPLESRRNRERAARSKSSVRSKRLADAHAGVTWKPASGLCGCRCALGQEFAVAPALDDMAAVDDANFVRHTHRRKPMGDHERGASRANRFERRLHGAFDSLSSADVASSSSSSGASLRKARAMEMRCLARPKAACPARRRES